MPWVESRSIMAIFHVIDDAKNTLIHTEYALFHIAGSHSSQKNMCIVPLVEGFWANLCRNYAGMSVFLSLHHTNFHIF